MTASGSLQIWEPCQRHLRRESHSTLTFVSRCCHKAFSGCLQVIDKVKEENFKRDGAHAGCLPIRI